jgi:guanylate kinase
MRGKFRSRYIVLSSPSGGGKTTIVRALLNRYENLVASVSATTRPQRYREVDGRDYFFLTDDAFRKEIAAGNFLEYEEVHGFYYGTPKKAVDEIVDKGNSVLFDIDVKGALSIKRQYPDALLIFIKVSSEEELRRRLSRRKSEPPESIEKRLQRLPFEYSHAERFDYILVNENLNKTVAEVEKLIISR